MKRVMISIAAQVVLLSLASNLGAQESEPSLGKLARQERERKQGKSGQAGTTAVANPAVGVRLVIPQGWKAREVPDKNPYLVIDCLPARPNSCWLMVKSRGASSGSTTITDADRQAWQAAKHPRYQTPMLLVSSRDLRVAGYQAYEVIIQSEHSSRARVRTVYVLAPDVRRLFEFSFSASAEGQDRFAKYAPAIEATLQSFSPLSRPRAELSEGAIPESLKTPGTVTPAGFELKSTAFKPGGDIPKKFTCDGSDVSPALAWSEPPARTQSFALIADDPDAPAGTWVHWVAYNLAGGSRQLPEGLAKSEEVQGGGRQGLNDFGKTGYGGPCPPRGKPHRYFFKLYALDAKLSLNSGATKSDVEQAMRGHILSQAELMGRFGH